jgi:hypothetical protein
MAPPGRPAFTETCNRGCEPIGAVKPPFLPLDRLDPHTCPLYEKPTYPANLCLFFRCAEFARNCEDLGETVGDAVEAAARVAVRQGAPEHLDYMLSSAQ